MSLPYLKFSQPNATSHTFTTEPVVISNFSSFNIYNNGTLSIYLKNIAGEIMEIPAGMSYDYVIAYNSAANVLLDGNSQDYKLTIFS